MTAVLPAVEAAALAEHEQAVERGLSTFLDVGRALLAIRDGRLYRAEHDTFESYCQERWQLTDRYVRNLMVAAEIGTMVPVENERQARELAPLLDQPEKLRETWEQVNEQTGGKPTAAAIREVVRPKQPLPAGITEITTKTYVDEATGEVVEPSAVPITEHPDYQRETTAGLGEVCDADPVGDYLDDDDAKDRAYMREFLKALSRAGEITSFDPERVGPLLTDLEVPSVQHLARQIPDYVARVERARAGLRVISGGRS